MQSEQLGAMTMPPLASLTASATVRREEPVSGFRDSAAPGTGAPWAEKKTARSSSSCSRHAEPASSQSDQPRLSNMA